ncbi:type VI secretion system protein TssA [Aliamphritea ceti]|uniref:type VI secretion system protein TssA n=1 Tax=Aliamphritea ceti TaxID=1524258 RepID=UPI0021C47C9F|nr:type VI secretion system protein TssA [Aliamphritea ceti]
MDQQEVLNYALPLSGELSAGPEVKHNDDFTALEDELRKSEGINIQPVDWDKVETLAAKILKEQSKDLRVAARLAAALFYRYSFEGLNLGFQLLRDLVNAPYWSEIHPARPKSRGAAVTWLLQKIDRPFSEYQSTLDQAVSVIDATNAFVELDNSLADKLGDKAPSLFDFRNVLGRYKQEAEFLLEEAKQKQAEPEPAPEPEISKPVSQDNGSAPVRVPAEQPTPAAAPEAVKAPVHTPVAVSSSEDIAKALRSCGSTITKAAHLLRSQRVNDAYPYFLLRSGVWMQLKETPPDAVLPAPAESKVMALKQLEQAKDWPGLIEECEKTFASGQVFWLSLHRMVANALEAITAKEAAQAVKDSVSMLVSRMPELLNGSFANGEGFADEMTKAWIASLSTGSVDAPAADKGSATASAPWHEVAAKAKQSAISGDFDQGLAMFKSGIAAVSSLREQAYWQFEQARYCFESGYLDIAQPQLTYLQQMIEEKQLQHWEPLLHLDVIRLLVNCHMQNQTKKKYTTEQLIHVDQLKAHLCLMDPLGALSILKTN